MMNVRVTVLSSKKSTGVALQDATSVLLPSEDDTRLRVTVADGAGGMTHAAALARDACAWVPRLGLLPYLARLPRRWEVAAKKLLSKRQVSEERQPTLAWLQESTLLEQGPGTTIAFVQAEENGQLLLEWIGDTVIFYRERGQTASLPRTRVAEFPAFPDLALGVFGIGDGTAYRREGTWAPGARISIATDGLAKWIRSELERNRCPWCELDGLQSDSELDAWARERRGPIVEDDDLTLVTIWFW